MIYRVLVKPGSAKDEVIKAPVVSVNGEAPAGDAALIVRTRKKAHDGEANKAVIELLSDYLGVPKTRLLLKSGATSRHKTFELL